MPRIRIVEDGNPENEVDDSEGQAFRHGVADAVMDDAEGNKKNFRRSDGDESDDTEGNKKNFR